MTVVEGASIAPDELPKERLEIKLTPQLENIAHRDVEFRAVGKRYEKVMETFHKNK